MSHPPTLRPGSPLRVIDRVFRLLNRRPPRGRVIAGLTVAVAVVGLIDYVTGRRISLGLAYLPPLVLAVAWLGPRAGSCVALASVILRTAGDEQLGQSMVWDATLVWNLALRGLFFLFIVWVVHNLVTLQRELEARVRERTAELEAQILERRQTQAELLAVSARERSDIGRELHDQLGQHLTGTALAAQVLSQHLATGHPAAAQEALAIVRLIEQGITQTSGVARGLLLSAIDPERLPSELEELCRSFSKQAGIRFHFCCEGHPLAADASAAAQLYRIAQESLRNILRHSSAKRATVTLAGDARALCLIIEDDGRGLPRAGEQGSGMGLRIMRHRAASVGGDFQLLSNPGGGTRVVCCLPAESRPAT